MTVAGLFLIESIITGATGNNIHSFFGVYSVNKTAWSPDVTYFHGYFIIFYDYYTLEPVYITGNMNFQSFVIVTTTLY